MTKNQIILISIGGVIVLIFFLVFLGILPGLNRRPVVINKTTIQFWGVFDQSPVFNQIFDNVKNTYPYLDIKYRSFKDVDAYQAAILDALAAGQGPDIFMIQNVGLPQQINKITAAPTTKFSLLKLKQLFPKIVEQDFVNKDQIYALPLTIDTLALLYNRDLLNQAGIAVLPENWEDFKKTVLKLTKIDPVTKNILLAGAAIGGSNQNINYGTDLLYALMLQTGTKMVNTDFSSAAFASEPGREAFDFYTQFSNPTNPLYAWNNALLNSIDSFSQGNVAMIFDYNATIPEIKTRNAFLDLGIAPLPQPKEATQNLSYARYWGLTVSKQSKHANSAWDMVITMTTDQNNASVYAEKTKKAPALLTLINQAIEKPELSVFAQQALIARDWPQIDPQAIDRIFSEAIELIINGGKSSSVIREAQEKVTTLMSAKTF